MEKPITEYQIFEQQLGEESKLAIIRGGLNSSTPIKSMNQVVFNYCRDTLVCQFVDISLSDPWTRIIISGIDKLPLQNFEVFLRKRERKEKLEQIEFEIYKLERLNGTKK